MTGPVLRLYYCRLQNPEIQKINRSVGNLYLVHGHRSPTPIGWVM